MKSFIEVQFPIEKLSKECYKERMSGSGQTLTGLGKWWGRKPLILVRATVLGSLMTSSDNPQKDMDIFLKILTMDDDGLWLRNKNKKKFTREEFDNISYEERLKYCVRPEEIDNLPIETWSEINEYLDTNATNIQELTQELGVKQFGQKPIMTDVFAGGGSNPFESARMGCEVYASDLNPVAGLLTWASLNILSKSNEEIHKLKEFQQEVYDKVKEQVEEWGIEKNEKGEIADYYLYCNEAVCPYCGTKVPLAPSWIISTKYKTIAILKYSEENKTFDIIVKSNVSEKEFEDAKKGTIDKGSLNCPHCYNKTSVSVLRGDKKTKNGVIYGLRKWTNEDLIPRENDVFKERLYCIRYIDSKGNKKYCIPTEQDLEREKKVLKILKDNFKEWQNKGFIPEDKIVEGVETTRLFRERGWTYWHHLFNHRQLLLHGLFNQVINEKAISRQEKVISLLGINRCSNWNSKLCFWLSLRPGEGMSATFTNQALNTMYSYGSRTSNSIFSTWIDNNISNNHISISKVELADARNISNKYDIGITDPPYADAVNYHELTEFFLSWDKKMIPKIFPEWYADSKRQLAVKGTDLDFKQSMVDVYSNLTKNMSDNGMQVIMFTHQDTNVWADLSMILWASGLQVCQAWCISTETESGGLKGGGNYVKGTVLLVLRKQKSQQNAFLFELYDEVEDAVKEQIEQMKSIDFHNNFKEADYYLASYASALKVLTSYKNIEDMNIKKELMKERKKGEKNEIEKILDETRRITANYLIPLGFDRETWRKLTLIDRFYITGLSAEFNGDNSVSTYQELARTFGVNYTDLLGNTKANSARLKNPSDLQNKMLNDDVFGKSLIRNVMFAIYSCVKKDKLEEGKNWLRTFYGTSYISNRRDILNILEYFVKMGKNQSLKHWEIDSKYANMLFEFIKNETV